MESYDIDGVMKLLQELQIAPARGQHADPKVSMWWDKSEWAAEHWHIPLRTVSAYFVMVWVLPLLISRPFKSKPILFLWNAVLGFASTAGFLYYAYALGTFVLKNGIKAVICGDLYIILEENPDAIWVSWIFTMSKFVELGDTFWLILGQRPVIFLHWYHHITVLLYTWFGMAQHSGAGHVFIFFNTFVHSIMYTYYAATQSATLKPYFSPIAPYITWIQLTQMVFGVAATIAGYLWRQQDATTCQVSPAMSLLGGVMYGSYFLLFLQFYFRRFGGKKKDLEKKKA